MATEGIDAIGTQNSIARNEAANTASANERDEVSQAANEATRDEVRAQEDQVTSEARAKDNFERATPAAPSGFTSPAAGPRSDLDTLADRMAGSSPRADGLISDFRSNGGKFETSERGGYFDEKNKVIGVPQGSDQDRMRSMAHELGHYEFSKTADGAFIPPSRANGGVTDHQIEQRREHNYVVQNTERQLANEAHATIVNGQIRDQIRASTGTDIGVSGDSTARRMPFMPSASFAEQRKVIGDYYGKNLETSTTGENYRAYYNRIYVNQYQKHFLPGVEQ